MKLMHLMRQSWMTRRGRPAPPPTLTAQVGRGCVGCVVCSTGTCRGQPWYSRAHHFLARSIVPSTWLPIGISRHAVCNQPGAFCRTHIILIDRPMPTPAHLPFSP